MPILRELGWRTRRDLSDMCASAWKFQNCDTSFLSQAQE
jgi:hypothetical protein